MLKVDDRDHRRPYGSDLARKEFSFELFGISWGLKGTRR
jgi:hypothetical protein